MHTRTHFSIHFSWQKKPPFASPSLTHKFAIEVPTNTSPASCFYYERRIRTDVVVNISNHKHITTTTNLWMMSPRLHLRQLLGNSKTRMAIILVRNRRTTTRATSKVVNHPIVAAAAAAIMIVVVVASHLSIHGINDHSRGWSEVECKKENKNKNTLFIYRSAAVVHWSNYESGCADPWDGGKSQAKHAQDVKKRNKTNPWWRATTGSFSFLFYVYYLAYQNVSAVCILRYGFLSQKKIIRGGGDKYYSM